MGVLMSGITESYQEDNIQLESKWSAIYSLSLCVFCLMAAELLPISLLTPIATSLGVTEGLAGQAVSATSIVGMVASIFVAAATRRLNRRVVLLMFTAIFITSNILATIAPNYTVLLLARMLLGIALGGFWSMSAAISMRLVPSEQIPKALSIVFGGVSAAMAIAAPVGTYLGAEIGWRGAFLITAVLGVICFMWQFKALPSMPPTGQARLATLFNLLKRRQIVIGISGMVLVFCGHFSFFTYLRSFLETISGFEVQGVTLVLFLFGLANIAGTSFSGIFLRKNLWLTLSIVPLLMSVLAIGMITMDKITLATSILVVLWGFLFGIVPVSWTTWLTGAVPDETESGGGLQVAAIQLAVTAGASVGGILIDINGPFGSVFGGGLIMFFGGMLILVRLKVK